MIFRSLVIILSILWTPFAVAGPYAKEADDNPFLNGSLNSKYEGEVTALAGEIIDIKPTKQKFPVYKLDLRIDGIKHIWVTSIAPAPEGGIKLGDMIVFRGFITTSRGTDPDGDLELITGSNAILMAIKAQRVK